MPTISPKANTKGRRSGKKDSLILASSPSASPRNITAYRREIACPFGGNSFVLISKNNYFRRSRLYFLAQPTRRTSVGFFKQKKFIPNLFLIHVAPQALISSQFCQNILQFRPSKLPFPDDILRQKNSAREYRSHSRVTQIADFFTVALRKNLHSTKIRNFFPFSTQNYPRTAQN